ncbi:MAG: MBL fold metallo-hydrolase [Candidatus Delongbacteria bacterium]|nr:MBL fold metallo-hydrolase [bacterium]MBL7033845.1 MBL fold metallo-hydrolase [Candidatus Delongbacteria bacterium]
MNIGPYQLRALEADRFKLDGGAMFGVVPSVLWQKTNPADSRNRIDMTTRCLLIEGPPGPILVDVGIGGKGDKKFRSIFAQEEAAGGLTGALQRLGLEPGDIRHVILTHLHFDHVGGLTRLDQAGAPQPLFPNARHWFQRRQLDWARSPSLRDRASYQPTNWEPILAAGLGEVVDGDAEIFHGIRLYCVNGHTPAMQLVEIADEQNNLLYCADLIPTQSHIPLPFIMGYDLEAITTLREKERFLASAVERSTLLFFEHDPVNIVSRVIPHGNDYRAEPATWEQESTTTR